MLVLDATERGDAIATAIGGRQIAVPTVAEYEVTNVIRRYEAAGRLQAMQSGRAYARFRAIPLMLAEFSILADRIWELRPNVATVDAAYVTLAEALNTELLTADARLSRANGPRCRIVVFDREEPR